MKDKKSPFQKISFSEALKKAEKEDKIVFIDFFEEHWRPCIELNSTTWKDPKVISLLTEKTVALKINVWKNRRLACRYSDRGFASLALIRPDKTIIDILTGYQDAKTFISNFKDSFSGNTSLVKAQKKVEKSKGESIVNQVNSRYELAKMLSHHLKYEKSLKEYLWCFDEGMKKDGRYYGVRGTFLLLNISLLGKKYPPALDALKTRRDKILRKIKKANREDVKDFCNINHALAEDQITLLSFDKLPRKSPTRKFFSRDVFDLLLKARRYQDIFTIYSLDDFKRTNKAMIDHIAELELDKRKQQLALQLRKPTAIEFAKMIEALAGAGRTNEAQSLLKDALDFDSSEETLALLRQHLKRAKHPELLNKGCSP